MNNLHFEPVIDPTLWITLAVLLGAALAWYAWSRPSAVTRRRWIAIVGLTSAAAAGVLGILLNPIWHEPVPPPAGKPVLTVLVDKSASMAVRDAAESKSRFAAASAVAANIARTLGDRFDVQLRTFGESTTATSAAELTDQTADAPSSDITRAIVETLSTDIPQGHAALLLSDGIDNGPAGLSGLRDAVRAAKAMNVPIHASPFGGDTVLNDLEVVASRPQELSFAGQSVSLAVGVKQRGRLTDRAELVLLRNDQELSRQNATLSPDGTATVRFEAREDASGLYRYEVRIAPHDGEATTVNNSATVLLRVTERPVRALLLEGKPYWDGKFLVRTLAADPALDVDALVRVSDSRFVKRSLRLSGRAAKAVLDEAPAASEPSAGSRPWQRSELMDVIDDPFAFLEGPDGLASCQVVILGRDADVFLNDRFVERLRTWISRDGGSLVCFRGMPVSSTSEHFSRFLPVRWSPVRETRFRPRLTERGMESDWLTSGGDVSLERLPSLAAASTQERLKPLSVVLATSDKDQAASVFTYQPYGTGRVVALEGAGMWRWAFLAPQYQSHDEVYAGLWQSLLRWLVSAVGLIPGQHAALRTDQVNYVVGDAVTAFVLLREDRRGADGPKVELFAGDIEKGETLSSSPVGDEPGVYRVALGALPEGRYRLRMLDDTPAAGDEAAAAFDVRPNFREQLDVQARPDLLTYIAAETGGTVLSAETASRVGQEFETHLARSRAVEVRRLTAWDRWWVLTGILTMWGAAWGLRRSAGLV